MVVVVVLVLLLVVVVLVLVLVLLLLWWWWWWWWWCWCWCWCWCCCCCNQYYFRILSLFFRGIWPKPQTFGAERTSPPRAFPSSLPGRGATWSEPEKLQGFGFRGSGFRVFRSLGFRACLGFRGEKLQSQKHKSSQPTLGSQHLQCQSSTTSTLWTQAFLKLVPASAVLVSNVFSRPSQACFVLPGLTHQSPKSTTANNQNPKDSNTCKQSPPQRLKTASEKPFKNPKPIKP